MKISYNTQVKLFKIVLIIIIISIILLFLITPIIYLKLRSNGYIFASNMLRNSLKKDIIPPVFSGTIKNGGSYYLTAEKVTNNILNLNYKEGSVIQVSKPNLMYNTNQNGLIFSLTSDNGIIYTNEQLIKIPGKVFITSNHDYKATLEEVFINFKNYSLISSKPLTVFLDNQKLIAKGININQVDNLIILKGPVEVTPINHFNKNVYTKK